MHQHKRGRVGEPKPRTYHHSDRQSTSHLSDARYLHNTQESLEVNLITNAYKLRASKTKSIIYEYKLIVSIATGCRDTPVRVLNRNYVARSVRQLIMKELIPDLLGSEYLRGSVVIESNMEAIFSTKKFKSTAVELSDSVSTPKDQFKFDNLSVKTDLLSRLNVNIDITYARSFHLNSTQENVEILHSILHHQLLIDMLRYGSVYYVSHDDSNEEALHENRLDLISQHIMGISISGLRIAGDLPFVVINCSHSYITRSHRLIDLLATFIKGRPVPSICLVHSMTDPQSTTHRMSEIASILGTEEWFMSFCSILNGFKCRADIPEQQINLRFSLTEGSASSTTMQNDNNQATITVQEYYRNLGINLNYPNLPCLKSRSTNHPYYPLEMCSLLPRQKVPLFRLSTAARNHLTLLNKPKPDISKRSSLEAHEQVKSINHAHLESFGVQLSEDAVETKGSTLMKPTLQYLDREVNPQRDFWESGAFQQAIHLVGNWCIINTVLVDLRLENEFFYGFSSFCQRFRFDLGKPCIVDKPKQDILAEQNSIETIVEECQRLTNGNLRFVMFVIDSSSTDLNRLIHLTFDEHPHVTATCIRVESIMNSRQQRSIYRTLVHKLNARLGGTNVTYHHRTLDLLDLSPNDLMIVGLDVTHPDNELNGVSIVGCAYTYSCDLFRHRSLVWPQTARVEIIAKMDTLMKRLLHEYYVENKKRLPKQIVIYRDGVSHEEFGKVRDIEISKARSVISITAKDTGQPMPNFSYIIAQKRHTMRFFQIKARDIIQNPPSGTLIKQDVVPINGNEFYLYSNTSPQATARPLHYHVLLDGMGVERLQKLTYFLCFNFGKCSGTLSMPSSLKYAHNAAYDARNRVIAAREFSESRFYTSKFFC